MKARVPRCCLHNSMKLRPFILLFFLFPSSDLSAQDNKKIIVKAGSDLRESLDKVFYQYPTFTQGIVYFKNGTATAGVLNYNLFLDEMQFIDPKSDTLSLKDEQTILYIVIGNDSFYYQQPGYILLIASNKEIKLGSKEKVEVIGKRKIGAYDQPSGAGSISGYNTFGAGNGWRKLDIREDLYLAKKRTYYFGNSFNQFLPSIKKNLYKMFPKNEAEISTYLKEHPVDFNNQKDLEELSKFLETLER